MYSIGKILSILPIDSIMQYLQIVLSPSFEEIQSLVRSEPVSNILYYKICVVQRIPFRRTPLLLRC